MQRQITYGEIDVPWGKVFRLRLGDVDLPGNGADGGLGIFRVLYFAPAEKDQFKAVAGDSYITAIEFSNPVRAMAITSYGNATQAGSPHISDQLQMFANKKLRPVWRDRSDILAHLEERKVF